MNFSQNPYILLIIMTPLSGIFGAWIQSLNQKRITKGNVSTSDAATVFNQGQQNFQGAVLLVKEMRTEIDRLVKKIDAQDAIIQSQTQEITQLRQQLESLNDKLTAETCVAESCLQRVVRLENKDG